jgi:predicted DNA binding protein
VIAACLVVEFSATGDDCPLSRTARETGVTIDARPSQLRTDGNALLRFSAPAPDGVDADRGGGAPAALAGEFDSEDQRVDPARYGPVAEALDADDRVRYLHGAFAGDRVDFRCLSKRPCVAHHLTDAGFMAESIRYTPAAERHRGAVVGYDVLRGVLSVGADRSDVGDVDIAVERVYPLGVTEGDAASTRRWSITPAQEEALRTALEMGYFAVPREVDASGVADALEVSKSAFLERLRRGHRALLEQVL